MRKWINGLWMIKTLGLVPHFGMDKWIINKDECTMDHKQLKTINSVFYFRM
ncbi:hypothetical protein C1645_823441 [Glomus cerebriforme]|uniref:Uncharacterized protein n=1 Tax=Glomus cerebriforme TaxID=658196 RepID=A0A397SXJ4_9GLOM|nr:hypothetical protein C1645_823441 [Glomus cerebriforme]